MALIAGPKLQPTIYISDSKKKALTIVKAFPQTNKINYHRKMVEAAEMAHHTSYRPKLK